MKDSSVLAAVSGKVRLVWWLSTGIKFQRVGVAGDIRLLVSISQRIKR